MNGSWFKGKHEVPVDIGRKKSAVMIEESRDKRESKHSWIFCCLCTVIDIAEVCTTHHIEAIHRRHGGSS